MRGGSSTGSTALLRIVGRCLALSLALSGCGQRDRGVSPVSGKVFLRSEPAAGALVVFHPVGDENPMAIRPSAMVSADGSFRLTSNPANPGDGASPGEYIVAITWPKPVAPPTPELGMRSSENRSGEPPEDRLDGKYRDETCSPLRATVKPGKNVLEPFQLP